MNSKKLSFSNYFINLVCSVLFGVAIFLTSDVTSFEAFESTFIMYIYFNLRDEIRNNKN